MLPKESDFFTIVKEQLVTRHGFSIDGIKATTVKAIRVNANLETILENVKMLVHFRRKEGKQKPAIAIRYALMRSNIEELPEAVKYWGEVGIDSIDCSYLSLCNGIDPQESLYFHQKLMKDVFSKAQYVASFYPNLTLNLPDEIPDEQNKKQEPVKCNVPWYSVIVDTDGQIFPCYRSLGINAMGNVYTDGNHSFKKIWNNSGYQHLRSSVNNDSVEKFNSYCSVCQSRFGMGCKAVHLGDEILLGQINDEATKSKILANRSR
jgi:radical SAM protein with 4Fe4S-binding SPASM domain